MTTRIATARRARARSVPGPARSAASRPRPTAPFGRGQARSRRADNPAKTLSYRPVQDAERHRAPPHPVQSRTSNTERLPLAVANSLAVRMPLAPEFVTNLPRRSRKWHRSATSFKVPWRQTARFEACGRHIGWKWPWWASRGAASSDHAGGEPRPQLPVARRFTLGSGARTVCVAARARAGECRFLGHPPPLERPGTSGTV
jgi:hypothetical protein